METGDFCSKGLMVLSTNRLLLPNSFGASFVLIFISDFSTTGATGFAEPLFLPYQQNVASSKFFWGFISFKLYIRIGNHRHSRFVRNYILFFCGYTSCFLNHVNYFICLWFYILVFNSRSNRFGLNYVLCLCINLIVFIFV